MNYRTTIKIFRIHNGSFLFSSMKKSFVGGESKN